MAATIIYEELEQRIKELEKDVEECKKLEKDLLIEKRFSQSVINSLPGMFYLFDEEGKMHRWNKYLENITEYSAEEISKMSPFDYFDEENKKIAIEKAQEGFAKGSSEAELYILSKSGKKIPHYFTGLKTCIDDVAYLVGMAIDISECKQAEEAMKESEKKFRSLFNLSPQAIALTEVENGRFVNANDKLCELTQYTRDEIIGFTTTELGLYTEEDRFRFITKLKRYGEVNGLEMDFIAKDGSILNSLMFARVIQIAGESFILTIFHDLTAQKRLQGQLEQAQKMECLGKLAGGIAHDFNNILSPILLHTEIMLEDVPAEGTLKLNLQEVYHAVIRARVLIRQILTFSRQTEPEKTPLIISPIVKEALKLLRSTLPATIEIRQNIKADVSVVLADSTQIHQILMNLCTNAAHAMREKGGVLEIILVDVDLKSQAPDHIPDLEPGQYVKLVVSDTGTGMESSVKERIFEPYFTTKNKGEGTGLGLAVVHGIVKSSDGAITVDSELGKGTVVQVFLPLIKEKISTKSTSSTQLPRGNERVLLIDDEISILKVQQQMLERLGYRVDISESGLAALDVFRGDPDRFDLIITDYTMPKMTGTDLAKEVMSIRDDIPIILCTGFSEMIDEKKVKAIGIADYIEKPPDQRDYAMRIRKVLDME